MSRIIVMTVAAVFAAASPAATEPTLVTWTGWFSDKNCARTPPADELVRPNGTACVKDCLLKGAAPVFLSEQANAIFEVGDHALVRDDVGYRVEITALVDVLAKTISVRSVKRLSEVTAMCLLPKKKTGH